MLFVDTKPCFSQLMPICSKRPSSKPVHVLRDDRMLRRGQEPLQPPPLSHQLTGVVPMLHEVVPIA